MSWPALLVPRKDLSGHDIASSTVALWVVVMSYLSPDFTRFDVQVQTERQRNHDEHQSWRSEEGDDAKFEWKVFRKAVAFALGKPGYEQKDTCWGENEIVEESDKWRHDLVEVNDTPEFS